MRITFRDEALDCSSLNTFGNGFVYRNGSALQLKQWHHLRLAKALTYSCWQMYNRTATGLSPEYVVFTDMLDPTVPKTQKKVRTLILQA